MGIAVGSQKRTDHLLNKFGLQMYRLEQQGSVPTDGRPPEHTHVDPYLTPVQSTLVQSRPSPARFDLPPFPPHGSPAADALWGRGYLVPSPGRQTVDLGRRQTPAVKGKNHGPGRVQILAGKHFVFLTPARRLG